MKISVCMATYNGELYIQEQVASILQQLSSGDELIVSDDHSKDRTVEMLKEFKDERIKIVTNLGEKGYTKNFENALNYATGEIVFLSDQDDVWVDKKVELMRKRLETCDMVISNAEVVNSKLERIHPSHFQQYNVRTGFWLNFTKTRYVGACMAFHKELLNKALPFPKNQKLCAHDYWLTLIGEAFFNVELEETPLLKYRRHTKNASTGGTKSENSFFKKLKVRLYCLLNLVLRYKRRQIIE